MTPEFWANLKAHYSLEMAITDVKCIRRVEVQSANRMLKTSIFEPEMQDRSTH